jgi:hypothetical protein
MEIGMPKRNNVETFEPLQYDYSQSYLSFRPMNGRDPNCITVLLLHCKHTSARQVAMPLWPRENGMEVAAFVMLGSVALWFAQQFSDNQL